MMKCRLYLISLVLLVVGCERRELEDVFIDTAKIPVSIDWSLAGLDPATDKENLYRASVWFFSKDGAVFDGKNYKEFIFNSPLGGEVALAPGRYSVLILNNSVSDFSDDVGFRGTDNYDTFEYYVNPDTGAKSGDNDVLEPEILATWRLDNYEVTTDMVIVRHETSAPISDVCRAKAVEDLKLLQGISPERLTYLVHTKVYVQNIKSAAVAQARLTGMAHSVLLASKKVSTTTSSFIFELNNRSYDGGDSKHGTVEAMFHSLGLMADSQARYGVKIGFTLVDKYNGSATYPTPPAPPFSFDVTKQVKLSDMHKLNITIQFGFDSEKITLPDLYVPGGIQPDVGDWGDEFPIDIPI